MKKVSELFGIEHIEIDYPDIKLFDCEIEREEALKRNATIVTCPKCGVKGNKPNMLRWHFDNCKTKLKNCLHCGNIIPRQGIKDSYMKKSFIVIVHVTWNQKKENPPLL